ncbi:hypothetical protein TSUD_350360 [Trifolium subterraneum]|uniref:Reverse transcriptase zinc-binding domain-containing protein n=1 Tax=Trifolium subterraneum TaxID=3900 RepID=A0A2Z6NZK6_TRISU|nr:hypothetical protein TSUD_350360 [Trifolium subterraneum]
MDERWHWNFKWRRNFFVWEEELYRHLLEVIASVPITKALHSWVFALGGQFSISSLYTFLYKKFLPPSPTSLVTKRTVAKVWGSWAPLKVIVFSWQALLGRLPTRDNLARRDIVFQGAEACYVFCGGANETENHLLASWHGWFGPRYIGGLFSQRFCGIPLMHYFKASLYLFVLERMRQRGY